MARYPRVRSIAISVLALGSVALIGSALVSITNEQTHARIAANQRAQLLQALGELVDASRYDNALERDIVEVVDPDLLGTPNPVTIYRARKKDRPVAALIASQAPSGYSGAIELLVAINWDGSLAGVRVTAHRETPGLGDAIEARRSTWITAFDGRSLRNPSASGWRVKRDGGVFDQFTGATITPRAVVEAVHKTLRYYRANREQLFAAATKKPTEVGIIGREK